MVEKQQQNWGWAVPKERFHIFLHIHGQEPKENLTKTPQGRFRLDMSSHLCTKRVVRPWNTVLERVSVGGLNWHCSRGIWTMPLLMRFSFWSALKGSGGWTQWSLWIPSNWNISVYSSVSAPYPYSILPYPLLVLHFQTFGGIAQCIMRSLSTAAILLGFSRQELSEEAQGMNPLLPAFSRDVVHAVFCNPAMGSGSAAHLEGEVEMSAAHVWQGSRWRPEKFSHFYDSFLFFLKETVLLHILVAYEVSGKVRTLPPLKKTLLSIS